MRGKGTQAEPYIIETTEQFIEHCYKRVVYEPKTYFKLDIDVDLTDAYKEKIKAEQDGLSEGTGHNTIYNFELDGNGHTLTGVFGTGYRTGRYNEEMYGYLYNGGSYVTFRNLNMDFIFDIGAEMPACNVEFGLFKVGNINTDEHSGIEFYDCNIKITHYPNRAQLYIEEVWTYGNFQTMLDGMDFIKYNTDICIYIDYKYEYLVNEEAGLVRQSVIDIYDGCDYFISGAAAEDEILISSNGIKYASIYSDVAINGNISLILDSWRVHKTEYIDQLTSLYDGEGKFYGTFKNSELSVYVSGAYEIGSRILIKADTIKELAYARLHNKCDCIDIYANKVEALSLYEIREAVTGYIDCHNAVFDNISYVYDHAGVYLNRDNIGENTTITNNVNTGSISDLYFSIMEAVDYLKLMAGSELVNIPLYEMGDIRFYNGNETQVYLKYTGDNVVGQSGVIMCIKNKSLLHNYIVETVSINE